MAKNNYRKLSPASEVKGVKIPICNFKSIYIGLGAQAYLEYMNKAHNTFTEKFPMEKGCENMEEYKEFTNQRYKPE